MIKVESLDEKNLDWEKARRWGELVLIANGFAVYLWKNHVYFYLVRGIG